MYICKTRTAYVHIKSADLDAGVGHLKLHSLGFKSKIHRKYKNGSLLKKQHKSSSLEQKTKNFTKKLKQVMAKKTLK